MQKTENKNLRSNNSKSNTEEITLKTQSVSHINIQSQNLNHSNSDSQNNNHNHSHSHNHNHEHGHNHSHNHNHEHGHNHSHDHHENSDNTTHKYAHNLPHPDEPNAPKYTRRDFLKLMGATTFMAAAACRRPTEQIVPAVINVPEEQAGIPTYYSSVTPQGTGIVIKTRDGRPIKIAGNPDHPITKGGVSASDIASLMDLYDPDRLRRPAVIDKKTGKRTFRKEELIIPIVNSKIKNDSFILLTGPISSPSTRALIESFIKKYPKGKHVEFKPDPSLRQIASGQELCYGKYLVPFYRFDRAELVLSIDGDFLGTMPLSTIYTQNYSQYREMRKKNRKINKLISFESIFSLTGSNAEERYGIRPGDQSLIALSLAAQIVVDMGKSKFANDKKLKDFLKDYLPGNVSTVLKHKNGLYKKGHFERIISRIAHELWDLKGRSLVLGGSTLSATSSGRDAEVSINLLNSILENDGKTIDYKNEVLLPKGTKDSQIRSLISELASGKIETLIFSNANLLYHLPTSFQVKDALLKGPKYILSLNDRIDETSLVSNAILPTSHYLESWGDVEFLKGLYSIQQPVIRPLHNTLSFEDRLIQLADGNIDGFKTYYDFLQNHFNKKIASKSNPKKLWNKILKEGFHYEKNLFDSSSSSNRSFLNKAIDALPPFKEDIWSKAKENELYLGLYYNLQVGDGSLANNAYRQELPEPVTKIVWDNYISILPETARKLDLKQGSIVKVQTAGSSDNDNSSKTLYIPVHLQPGLHPQAAVIALGYGRTSAGKIANKVGVNLSEFITSGSDSLVFAGNLINLKDTNNFYKLATTQSIYQHKFNKEQKAFFTPKNLLELPYAGSSQQNRPILRETTFNELKSGNFELRPKEVEYPKNQELIKDWDYKETKWHMVIDLNSCTGCGACVTSCNTENNIPMVGKDQVAVGREMHWMRIDRYFDGEEENPQVGHQPMLCQHCDNAPCENVCPVAATTHNSEGLNTMTYNRCIGTRYCSNNCPYKVRRFNWYENWYYWEGAKREISDPAHLALNPDVTVRSRGVMEKCTFCVQRISAARQDSHVKGKKTSADGAVVTACQEVCPTKAITFGNIVDPKSEVALHKSDDRAYQVLDFLNVKPSITYLAKVKNLPAESGKKS